MYGDNQHVDVTRAEPSKTRVHCCDDVSPAQTSIIGSGTSKKHLHTLVSEVVVLVVAAVVVGAALVATTKCDKSGQADAWSAFVGAVMTAARRFINHPFQGCNHRTSIAEDENNTRTYSVYMNSKQEKTTDHQCAGQQPNHTLVATTISSRFCFSSHIPTTCMQTSVGWVVS